MNKTAALIALALLLGGCSAGASGSYIRTAPSASSATTTQSGGFRPPQVMRGSGLDSVIGRGAGALTSRFGEARIDLVEGDARKLQFASQTCVLDVFLYPVEAGNAPVATHVEARLRDGGAATDRASCIAEVERAARG